MTYLELENERNGHESVADWRGHVMSEALRGHDNGEYTDAMVRALRQYWPDLSVHLLWLNRLQVLRFLKEEATGFRSLIPGSCFHEENEERCPFLGWYAVEWEGATVEIALRPSLGVCDTLFCMSESEEVVWRFGKALEEYAERPSGRSLLYTHGWEDSPELDEEIGKVTWDDIVLEPGLMASVRESVESFSQHREAYAALGFDWKRGILLVGPPGTGKTMICKAAAAALPDRPFLYVRAVRDSRSHEAIETIFERARDLSPCILAFEDMDGMIMDHNRTIFLNEMDGFRSNEGLLIIASSNHPGKIDEALLKRPSRFDRVYHIGLPGLEERKRYCLQVLTRSKMAERLSPTLDMEWLVLSAAEFSQDFTPAYLKEAIIAAALQRAQAGSMNLDEEFAYAILNQIEELKAHLRRMKNPEALAEMQTESSLGFRRR